VAYSSLTGWDEQGRLPGLLRLSSAVWRTRAYGDFWSHVMVAEGAGRRVVRARGLAVGHRPLQVLVEEAGGRFTDLAVRRGRTAAASSARTGCCTTLCSTPSPRGPD
jgi:histidinol-phosphatase